jgi:O-acetyl-ADP-ribose deacetylase (regulator of RNase III)
VVSPANSYARLDGGFDDAISRAWSPSDDYLALTRAVQAQLYDFSYGYLPPGQCYIATIPTSFKGKGRYNGIDWGCKYIALCPTMHTPQDVNWDREVIYNCIWSLLVAIKRHNRSAVEDGKINSILMTPLATGVGGVSLERWARQTALALKHAVDSKQNPELWGSIDWVTANQIALRLSQTHQS